MSYPDKLYIAKPNQLPPSFQAVTLVNQDGESLTNPSVRFALAEYLKKDGSPEMALAATGSVFQIAPPAGWVYRVANIVVTLEAQFVTDPLKFGNGTALANGIDFFIENDSGSLDLLDGRKITRNKRFFEHGGNKDIYDGTTTDVLGVNLNIGELTNGGEITLDAEVNGRMYFKFNDTLVAAHAASLVVKCNGVKWPKAL